MSDDRKPNPAPELAHYADVGYTVHWYAGGDPTLRPLVGIVVEKSPGGGPGMSNLTIATFTGSGFAIQESVLPMGHPLVRRQGNTGGGWRHRPTELALLKLMLALGLLVWDGDETYVADPGFSPERVGESLAQLAASKAGHTLTFKSAADADAAANLFMSNLQAKNEAENAKLKAEAEAEAKKKATSPPPPPK